MDADFSVNVSVNDVVVSVFEKVGNVIVILDGDIVVDDSVNKPLVHANMVIGNVNDLLVDGIELMENFGIVVDFYCEAMVNVNSNTDYDDGEREVDNGNVSPASVNSKTRSAVVIELRVHANLSVSL